MIDFFNKLNSVLSKKDKIGLFYLFLFAIFIAVIETAGVSVIMPYISLANDFSLIETNQYYRYIFEIFNFSNYIDFIIFLGFSIIIFYIFRAVINAFYIYKIISFTQITYHKIVNKLFSNYLNMPYKNFINQNSSSLTKVIINEALNITDLFRAFLILLSEILVFVFIYSVLLYINYQIALTITVILFIVGLIIVKTISKIMKIKGIEREKYQKIFYEILNKNFNNIKMLKLQNTQNALEEFNITSKLYTNTNKISGSFQQFPRLILEVVGFSIVVLIVIFLLYSTRTDISSSFGLITIFVLGLYRLLPSTTRILLSFNQILLYYKSLDLVCNDFNIDTERVGNNKIIFNNRIELKEILFSYNKNYNIINKLNLTIERNDKIAFIGESGSGKSTLVDIIMGLNQVTGGGIYIDNEKLSSKNLNNWRNHFGYIPQSVYLFDGNVAQNVAFGLEIDEEKVIKVLEKANIWEFLKDKDGLTTKVGESGVMLSGGQKQRIAIARALYKNPDILVLDEATSALDDETEAKIMNEIYEIAKDKTLIIIAHRLSTIRRCNKVYKIENGEIKNV